MTVGKKIGGLAMTGDPLTLTLSRKGRGILWIKDGFNSFSTGLEE